jgi:uncharacterized membrane protein
MSEKPMFVLVVSYASIDDARADEQLVKQAYKDRVLGTYDMAELTRDANGKVQLEKIEKPTEHGAEIGVLAGTGLGAVGIIAASAAGVVVGLAALPVLLATASLGALTGGLIGHIRKGLPDADQQELSKVLGSSPAALVFATDTDPAQAMGKILKRAKSQVEKKVMLDIDELKKSLPTAA